jgi:hypothetical protein
VLGDKPRIGRLSNIYNIVYKHNLYLLEWEPSVVPAFYSHARQSPVNLLFHIYPTLLRPRTVAQLKWAYQRVHRAIGDLAQQHLRVPGIWGQPSTSTSSDRLDCHQDSSLVFTFPEEEDKYAPITPRGYDDLPEESKGEIHYLEYSNQHKLPSFHYIDTEGNRAPCEFINSKWYTLHHYKDGYHTSRDLEFTAAELCINKLLEL